MGRKCAHICCKSKVSLHTFPKNGDRFCKWLSAAGRSSPVGSTMFLCSTHFENGEGPSKEHPDPIPYKKVPGGDISRGLQKCSPRIIRRKRNKGQGGEWRITPKRKIAVDALLSLSMVPPGNPVAAQCSTYESSSLNSSPIIQQSPTQGTSVCKRVRTPGSGRTPFKSPSNKKRAVYQPKRFPWELMSPSKKKFGIMDCDSDLGCSIIDANDNDETPHPVRAKRKLKLTEAEGIRDVGERASNQKEEKKGKEMVDKRHSSVRTASVQCSMRLLSYQKCKLMSEKNFKFFTGVTQETFELLYTFVGDEVVNKLKYDYAKNTPSKLHSSDLTGRDRFFMTLIRLRRGVPVRDLAYLFSVSHALVSHVFYTWIRLLSISFQRIQNSMFLTRKDQKNKPACFKPFKNLRAIIDCVEVRIQKPYHFKQQGNTHSKYKAGNTVKFLIAISVIGLILFISEAFEGSMSDRRVVLQSGFLHHLSAKDAVMADRGFNVESDLNAVGVELLVPPFLGKRKKMTAREVALTKAIAKSRVHVERAIGKVREFRLVRHVVPNTMLPYSSDIVLVCCCLVNFNGPYINQT